MVIHSSTHALKDDKGKDLDTTPIVVTARKNGPPLNYNINVDHAK